MSTIGIIFSNLNNNNLTRMTATRTVAAIPFACRYRLVDFALSNLVNADIANVSIVTNYNFRSLVAHVGSGKDWDLARHNGGVNVVSPYQNAGSQHAKVYENRLEALLSMREALLASGADTVVLTESDYVFNLDLKAVLRQHKETGAHLTVVAAPCAADWKPNARTLLFSCGKDNSAEEIVLGDRYDAAHPLGSLNVFVLDMQFLQSLLIDAVAHNYKSLTHDILLQNKKSYRIFVYPFTGACAYVGSFEDYYNCSMDLLRNPAIRGELLDNPERRVYTNVRNSIPVVYEEGAAVHSSMIADDCVIEGTVENCILFRGVHVGKGAVVRNSVLLNNTYVGEDATVDCVVSDAYVNIRAGRNICGCETLPIYIDKDRTV